jgi:hypothetical protein
LAGFDDQEIDVIADLSLAALEERKAAVLEAQAAHN